MEGAEESLAILPDYTPTVRPPQSSQSAPAATSRQGVAFTEGASNGPRHLSMQPRAGSKTRHQSDMSRLTVATCATSPPFWMPSGVESL